MAQCRHPGDADMCGHDIVAVCYPVASSTRHPLPCTPSDAPGSLLDCVHRMFSGHTILKSWILRHQFPTCKCPFKHLKKYSAFQNKNCNMFLAMSLFGHKTVSASSGYSHIGNWHFQVQLLKLLSQKLGCVFCWNLYILCAINSNNYYYSRLMASFPGQPR